jgi:hypothetical protein
MRVDQSMSFDDLARRAAEIGARLSEYADRVDAVARDVDDVRSKVGTAAEDLAQRLSERPRGENGSTGTGAPVHARSCRSHRLI